MTAPSTTKPFIPHPREAHPPDSRPALPLVYNQWVKITGLRITLTSLLGCAFFLAAFSGNQAQNLDRPVAVSSGAHRVFVDELPPDAAGEVAQLKMREYEIKLRAYQNMLVRRLLEAEAKKRSLTLEQMMEAEGRARAPQPNDEELLAYFEQKKANYEEPLAKIKDKVRADYSEERLRDGQRQFVQEVWRAAQVEVLLPLPRFEVATDPQRVRGNLNAPVQIIEFSDFQCPFCRRVQPTLQALLAKYPGQISISFRDFPIIELHPLAHVSAQAAKCAQDKGKFWEYHDLLFAESGRPTREMLGKFAAQLGLEEKAFAACLDGGTHKGAVDRDLEEGLRVGVGSTPAFFINGVFVSGAQPLEDFTRLIEGELKGKGH